MEYLKSKTNDEWNDWRLTSKESVSHDLNGIVHYVDISCNKIEGSYKSYDFSYTIFSRCVIKNAIFNNCNFHESNFIGANLIGCKFINCNIGHSNFYRATIKKCSFKKSYLGHSNFSESEVYNTQFQTCRFHNTILYRAYFQEVTGLESSIYEGFSYIDLDHTRDRDKIPLSFIRGVGTPEFLIDAMHNKDKYSIEFYSCFISYSNIDFKFANKLYSDLQNAGIRCWFAPEDMKTGDKIRNKIDESIRIYDKLLLILSSESVNSFWVEHEVENAFDKEGKTKSTVLFPIRIDNSVMKSESGWSAKIKRERHIADFLKWKNNKDYSSSLKKLVQDLKST